MLDESFKQFKLHRFSAGLGAEVHDIDVRELSDAAFVELKRALDHYDVLALRSQDLAPSSLHRFARRLGPFSGNPIHVPVDGFDDIVKVVHEADDSGPNFGGSWHMDLPWFEKPPALTLLYLEQTPPLGGDTLFASLALAYQALSERMRRLIADLISVHSGKNSYTTNAALNSIKVRPQGFNESQIDIEHPLICTDPATARQYLFVSTALKRFQGMTEEESRPLIDYLIQHALRPQFSCRLQWDDGTLGIWRNNQLLHHAIDDYRGYRRVAYRTTVAGWRPQ